MATGGSERLQHLSSVLRPPAPEGPAAVLTGGSHFTTSLFLPRPAGRSQLFHHSINRKSTGSPESVARRPWQAAAVRASPVVTSSRNPHVGDALLPGYISVDTPVRGARPRP